MSTEFESDESAIQVRTLQREAILPTSDRGRLAAIIATCSMAGLAGGMALSMMAESQRVADELRREELKSSLRADEERFATPTAWLGVTVQIEEHHHECTGARITGVARGGPADRVGFHPGDIVEGFGGDVVCGGDHLVSVIQGSSIGATPSVALRRGHDHLVVHPTLGVLPRR